MFLVSIIQELVRAQRLKADKGVGVELESTKIDRQALKWLKNNRLNYLKWPKTDGNLLKITVEFRNFARIKLFDTADIPLGY